jgi:hypothetical protein
MVDSGDQISSGSEDFGAVYTAMIEHSLDRPASAQMTVTGTRIGDIIRFEVRFTNSSGVTLSAANGAVVTALIYEDPDSASEVPLVEAAGVLPITTLADGETRKLTLEVATQVDPERSRWVVLADYRPGGSLGAFDTLQAVAGP